MRQAGLDEGRWVSEIFLYSLACRRAWSIMQREAASHLFSSEKGKRVCARSAKAKTQANVDGV